MKRFFLFVGICFLAGALWVGYRWLYPLKPNVLLIVLDTLRADHLGTYGYERDTSPVLDAFARENLRFNYAVTAATWTPAAMASIFSGLYVTAHGMMPPNKQPEASIAAKKISTKLVDEVETLAEVFSKNGYKTAGVSSNPWLQRAFGYSQGFEVFKYLGRVRAGHVNRAGLTVLESLLQADKPFFLYLHYMDPHEPYDPPPEFKEMFQGPIERPGYNEEMLRNINWYDGEIRYLDSKLGELFAALKSRGVYDDLIIVIAADHGEQFKERGSVGHGFNLNDEELRVPLFIKTGRRVQRGEMDGVVSVIDIYPTILRLAGLKSSAVVQGQPLVGPSDWRSRPGVLAEIKRTAHYKGFVRSDGRKLIISYPLEQDFLVERPTTQLGRLVYDRSVDKFELSPVNETKLEKELEDDFWKLYEATRRLRVKEKIDKLEIDKKTINDLKSLGYM